MGRAVVPLPKLVKRTHQVSDTGPSSIPITECHPERWESQTRSFMDCKGLWVLSSLDPLQYSEVVRREIYIPVLHMSRQATQLGSGRLGTWTLSFGFQAPTASTSETEGQWIRNAPGTESWVSEESVIKDDFLWEVSEIRCEPKSVIPKPVFLTLTLNGDGV